MTMTSKLSLTPSNKIVYNEVNHERFEPGTEGRPIAYFVRTGGRFLWASSIRLAVIKALVTLSLRQIESAAQVPLTDLKDPQKDSERTVDPKVSILAVPNRCGECAPTWAVCPSRGAGNYGGWFCPCHGSHYDGSGRVREGPAPYNLEVPEYRFKDDGKVVIG
ncbi:hypothetical protein QJQ45_018643 [Haematococcus lacustris]|nr:hypothetical protein QJQ45_018643 [Haematococcus lacustris]